MKRRTIMLTLVLGVLAPLFHAVVRAEGFITIRDGYFRDAAANHYWIPRGFGYQTINPPVFATQTPEQIAYDFLEMKKSMRTRSAWISPGDTSNPHKGHSIGPQPIISLPPPKNTACASFP